MKKIYVAIPYSGIEEKSYKIANQMSYDIIEFGHVPFSPISMSHPIVEQSKIDHKDDNVLLGDWETWAKIDYAFIDWCDEIWVIQISEELVKKSTGVQAELEYAKLKNKKIKIINYDEYKKATQKEKYV